METEKNNKLAELPICEADIKQRELMRKADHASDVGTFMSLASSGLYFVESAITGMGNKKKFPIPVYGISLTGVTVGMGAVVYAMMLRHAAGKIARENDKEINESKTWTKKQDDRANISPVSQKT